MRVVSGTAGGIPLKTPGHDLRPTMDKVKGAIFSSLCEMIVGARVLDLFAGSGALGIEALSRGAAEATLIENHPQAMQAIDANLAKTRLAATVCKEDVFRFLQRNTKEFDLIFADPPYSKTADGPNFGNQLLRSKDLLRALAPGGIFVLERAPAKDVETPLFRLVRQRQYGASEILLLAHPQ